MSFFTPPAGLVARPEYASYKHQRPPTDWDIGGSINCDPPDPHGTYTVFTMGGSGESFTADPAAIEFFDAPGGPVFNDLTFAPYYAVSVRLDGPSTFGFWHNPQACRTEPPFIDGSEGPHVEAEISAVSLLDGVGVSTPATATYDGATVDENGMHANAWFRGGYLVNGAPPWPTPDGDGNTFGSVLFTAAQIPTVFGSIEVQSGPGFVATRDGVLAVYLTPYWLEEDSDPDEFTPYQYISGAA